VRSLANLKNAIANNPDKVPTFAVVHPASMHNLMLRYWLASAGIDPDQDVNIIIVPPSQMVANLMSGLIDGFCAGEPWNSRAVQDGYGYVIATDLDIFPGHPEKMLGVREDWVNAYPNTHNAMVKALIEACQFCDQPANRAEVAKILSRAQYIGADVDLLQIGLTGPFNYGTGEPAKHLPRFNQFYVEKSVCPSRFEGAWVLTQLARWGMTPFPRNWVEILERVRRVDLYGQAARELGIPDQEPDRHSFELFDGKTFNPDDPVGYLNQLTIHRNIQIEEVLVAEATV
jgi:nitrate/nitrite transport system ATP-binding protein